MWVLVIPDVVRRNDHLVMQFLMGDSVPMNFLIADTFTDSLARLTGDEQKAVKTTAFDLQLNPANPGMQFHKLDKAKDKNFWSVRVNRDIRLIVHKTAGSLLLCYVDHHDKAYALGRTAEAGNASQDRRGAAGGNPRDGARRSSSRSMSKRSNQPKPRLAK